MKYIGWCVVVLAVAGWLDLIDFHVCIKGPGECRPKLIRSNALP